jgi:hypothetical protein
MAIITTNAGSGNIGRDLIIGVTSNDGTTYTINQIVSVNYRAVTLDITKTLLNASTILADLPRFWEGTIEFVRGDSQVDQATWAVENAWLTQGPADFTLGSMVISITSPSGAGLATLTFTDVSFRLEDAGTWKADDVTIGKLSFRAGRRQVS